MVTLGTFRAGALLIAGAFLAATVACVSYVPVTPNAPSGELPAGVRITRSDGSVVVLAVTQVIGDTIRGFRENSTARVLIPVSDVQSVETARVEPVETIAAMTAGALVTYWLTKKIEAARTRPRPIGAPLL